MGIPSSPGMNLLTRMELVQSVTSKLMTQALRFFSSRCSTANTSPSTVTMPMSSSSVFIGTGTLGLLWVPWMRLEEKPRSLAWACMASFMAFWRRASVC